MKRFAIILPLAPLWACSVPKDPGSGFSAPVGIRMEATSSTPAFELAVASNTKQFPTELVSPLSLAVVNTLKKCPQPTASIVALNLSLENGAVGELSGAPPDEQARCIINALKEQKIDTKFGSGETHLQLLAQLRFPNAPNAKKIDPAQ